MASSFCRLPGGPCGSSPNGQPSGLKPGASASLPWYWGLPPWIGSTLVRSYYLRTGAWPWPTHTLRAAASTPASPSNGSPPSALQDICHPAPLCLEFLAGARLEGCCGYSSRTVAAPRPPFTSSPQRWLRRTSCSPFEVFSSLLEAELATGLGMVTWAAPPSPAPQPPLVPMYPEPGKGAERGPLPGTDLSPASGPGLWAFSRHPGQAPALASGPEGGGGALSLEQAAPGSCLPARRCLTWVLIPEGPSHRLLSGPP